MTDKLPRRPDGTFLPGSSGNPQGRPKRDRRIPGPDVIRDEFYDVAEMGVKVTIEGKGQRVSLLQANYMTLGVAGAGGDKQSALMFVTKMQQVSEQERREMARLIKRLDGIIPAYQLEPDPARRAALKEAWLNAVKEATGERERSTPGLGKPVPRRRR